MGSSSSKSVETAGDNLETFSLIWLDGAVATAHENVQAQRELRKSINQLKIFPDSDECEKYIKTTAVEDRIVLIVSGQLGRQIVPRIHSLEQLLSIYVYCQDLEANDKWASQYSKVKGVATVLQDLISRIKSDQEIRQQSRIYEPLSISIFDPRLNHEKLTTDLQDNRVQSQLLINSLLRMPPNPQDKNELIAISRQIYKNNEMELKIINEFEKEYTQNLALRWYTRDTFLSRLLNKALRRENIDILFLFHFLIVDIQTQLIQLRCDHSIKAYHSQLMSKNELEKLQDATGQFISINSFLSATTDKDHSMKVLKSTDGFERVLFIIDADPKLAGNKPFANIKSYNVDKEKEVLFMLGSIFEIVKINRETDGTWSVQLKLCSDNKLSLDVIGDDNNKLFSFGHVLVTIGKIDEAKIYYERLLKILTADHPNIARCREALADIADEKGEYDDSLRLYKEALDLNMKTPNRQNLNIASNFNSMGEIYRKKRDYKQALDYHKKALEILGENPVGKSLAKQAVCYNSIGVVCQDQQKYQEALDYYRKAFEIRKKSTSDDTSLGMSFNNIGNAYYFLRFYEDALYNYREALQIYKRNLPPNHPKLASTYNNIGAIYDDQNKLEDALSFYQDALKIYRSIYSNTQPNVIKIQENVQRIQNKLKQ